MEATIRNIQTELRRIGEQLTNVPIRVAPPEPTGRTWAHVKLSEDLLTGSTLKFSSALGKLKDRPTKNPDTGEWSYQSSDGQVTVYDVGFVPTKVVKDTLIKTAIYKGMHFYDGHNCTQDQQD